MTKKNVFLLRGKLTNTISGKTETLSLEKIYNVRFLRAVGKDAYYYDSELDLNFVDKSALGSIYEIETTESFVTASGRLRKAEEYIRRINYRYDWIQIRVNNEGFIRSIENKEELIDRWQRLKTVIRKDFHGEISEYGLERIDTQFAPTDKIWGTMYQYIHFGLLFPHIPKEHKTEWEHKRMIEFSEYENEKFKEHIVYENIKDDVRCYQIRGHSENADRTVIDKYEGNISMLKGDIFPEEVNLNVIFRREKITNEWDFSLLRYKE